MLLEYLEYLATPCPPALLDLGYLRELVAIGARYRRCRAAWDGHLRHSRQAIERAISRTPRRRTAIILGSGRLLDIPLRTLATAFERVILTDAIQPLSARWSTRAYPNVELVAADITGTVAAIHTLGQHDKLPVPMPYAPVLAPDVDLVVSLNMLSQLGVLPVEWIERRRGSTSEAAAERFAAALTRQHLDDLAACQAQVCLIADINWQHVTPDGTVVESHSSIYGIEPPRVDEEWLWSIAPAPELDPRLSERRRVIVAHNPGR